jgi:tetratricopeptide (TPR) repeat protein
MPASLSQNHGYELEVDVTPLDARSLRWELAAEYYGEPAHYMSTLLAFADTAFQKSALDQSVGYGVPAWVEMRDWDFSESECGKVSARITYVDTTWADEGATEAMLRHLTEASNYWGLPDHEERENPVVYLAPYEAKVVLRLHGTSAWTPSDRIASFETKGPKHQGKIEVDSEKEGEGRLVTVTAEFQLKERVLTLQEYQDFHKEALGFFMYAAQVYRFRHPLDGDRVKMIDQYVKEFPDDMGFRLKASMDLLGNNFGGYGEGGQERRRLARDLLEPLVQVEEPGMMAAVIAATVESMDGQYRKADEILDRARKANPKDLQLAGISLGVKRELDDWQSVVEISEMLVNETGSSDILRALILTQMILENEDEVERQLKRAEMMGAPLDSMEIMLLRFAAGESTESPETMEEALQFVRESQIDPSFITILESSLLMAKEDFGSAADLLNDLVAEDPTEPDYCNNLAWCLALSGRDLERARMLSEAASIMSDDPTISLNTHAAVLARLGEWSEARDLFDRLYQKDDRPQNMLVNGYFLGLAEWKLGHEEDAKKVWLEILNLPQTKRSRPWVQKINESQRLIGEGLDPTEAIFYTDGAAH